MYICLLLSILIVDVNKYQFARCLPSAITFVLLTVTTLLHLVVAFHEDTIIKVYVFLCLRVFLCHVYIDAPIV